MRETTGMKTLNMICGGNLRLTVQRKVILDVLSRNYDRYLSADEIYERAKPAYKNLGIATVYNALQKFEQVKIVCRIKFDDSSKFRLADCADKTKPHLICVKCGKVIDINDSATANENNRIEYKYGFKVTDRQIIYYGLCSECNRSDEQPITVSAR